MTINITRNEEKTTLAILGRLDTSTSPKLQETLLSEFGKAKHIELDFAELVYVSSAGLRVLLLGEKTAKAQGSRQSIVNVSPDIREVFEITGFSNVLHFE
ncbi:MAG: STAS domain-containing protein [Endomicrobia bacterium]|nr:STAS domain-containing protein [Endomicrobiia bacterium]